MWNPFKKKFVNFIGESKPMIKPALFQTFGFSSYNFQKLYYNQQNNKLLIDYFNNIAEVAAPVMKYVDGASQTKFICNIPEVEKLLNNPNGFQSWDDFISLVVLYKRLLGNSIINYFTTVDLFTASAKPKQLYVLNPEFTAIKIFENKDFRQTKIDKYIFNSLEVNKDELSIDPEFILHLKEPNPNFLNFQYLYGESRFCSCYKNIESITNSYNAKIQLYTSGPRLIITGKSQGEFASANTSDNIAVVQEAMQKYGSGANQYPNMVTDIPLDVFNASLNIQQLQINENNAADFQRICDAQNMDSKIFSDISSSTYANKEAALKDFYNNSFKSEMQTIFKDLEYDLKRFWPNLELTPDFSNISAIVSANIEENNRLLEDCKLGLITRNEYNEAIGKPIISDITFNENRVFIPSRGWVNSENLNIEGNGQNGNSQGF